MSDRPISHGAADCPPIGATSLVGQGGADWTNSRRQPTSAPRSRCGTDQSALQWPIAPCQPFRSRQDAYRLLVGRLAPIFTNFQFCYLFLRLTIKIILFNKISSGRYQGLEHLIHLAKMIQKHIKSDQKLAGLLLLRCLSGVAFILMGLGLSSAFALPAANPAGPVFDCCLGAWPS